MRIACALAIAVVGAMVPARAAVANPYAYNLVVPVTVTNLSAGQWFYVVCNLYDGSAGQGRAIAHSGSQSVSVDRSPFSQNVSVQLVSSAKPGSYTCWLVVGGSAGQRLNFSGNPWTAVPGWTGAMKITRNL